MEKTISDINEALQREFGRPVQRPAQLIAHRERIVFVREAQLHFIVYRRKGVERSSPAQHLHFLHDQRRLNAAGKTGANSEKFIFAPQFEARRNGRRKKGLAQALARQLTVWLVGQRALFVPPSVKVRDVPVDLCCCDRTGHLETAAQASVNCHKFFDNR